MEQTNFLIPEHRKLSKQEITKVLAKHFLDDVLKLPKIKLKDIALSSLGVDVGDVVEITRHSFVGETKYYRVVIN